MMQGRKQQDEGRKVKVWQMKKGILRCKVIKDERLSGESTRTMQRSRKQDKLCIGKVKEEARH